MNMMFFLFYCLMMTITPGPNNIMILSMVHQHGIAKAVHFCYGSIMGFGISLALAATFNAVLITFIPNVIGVMQWIGSLYMLYLAYQIIRMDGTICSKKEFSSFKKGFLLQFVNPKGVLFCLTVFPSFILPYYSDQTELIFFVFVITGIGAFSFFTWVFFGALLARWMQRYRKSVNGIMAAFLVYTAVIILGII